MAYDIGPKIGIDGEAEFRKALGEVNAGIRTLGTEMDVVVSSFDKGDRSEAALAAQSDVLTRKILTQKEKLDLLNKGLQYAHENFTEADTRTQKWQQAVNKATADLNKMERELSDLNQEMSGGGGGGFLGGLKEQASSLLGNGPLGQIMSGGGIGKMLMGGLAGGAVIGGIKAIGGAIMDVVDSTQEYRSIMASLEVSSQAAGYSTEQTAQTYERLQSVLGDTQTAATATANLQAIGLSQDQLMTITDASIGAWAKYGDSIPIDGLAEAINETIQAGQVTGTFADVLNWAGVNEDEFNAKLQAATSAGERADIVMQELARQGLAETGAAWIENNKDITEVNASTERWNNTMARLGGALAPVAAGIKNLGADAVNFLIDTVEGAISWFSDLPDNMREIGTNMIQGFFQGIDNMTTWLANKIRGFCSGALDAIKNFFGIRSPSRVMRDQVGKYMAEGIGVGFVDQLGAVRRRIDRSMAALIPEVPEPVPAAPNGPGYGSGGNGTGGGRGGVGNVYLGRRKVGELIREDEDNEARASGLYPVMG